METDCISRQFEFQGVGRRRVVAQFDGGTLTSDGGLLLLGEVERVRGIVRRFASCFTDHRSPVFTEHSVFELLAQRVFGVALGWEDLNDHDLLSLDPLLATVVGKIDPTGQKRRLERDRGRPLASSSTLNRLEWGAVAGGADDRYRKVSIDPEAVDRMFVDLFIESFSQPPKRLVLDLDATDDPIHGHQEGRFFHGYYKCYCYLPLYIFCGEHLLCARLRQSNIDASAGSTDELERIVTQLRQAWPRVQIVVRGDSGFAREQLMSWCERNGVDYVLGLARNSRLEKELASRLERVARRYGRTGEPQREFKDFYYQTRQSWSRQRRVIGKAEHLPKGANPRFVVTSLWRQEIGKKELYEQLYCARGEMENRIKEQQLYLFANRTSARKMKVNQLRLWVSSVAYTLLQELRRLGLDGSKMAKARCDTIRIKLLKIGARIRISVRRVTVSLATSYPLQALFAHVYDQLQQARAGPQPA